MALPPSFSFFAILQMKLAPRKMGCAEVGYGMGFGDKKAGSFLLSPLKNRNRFYDLRNTTDKNLNKTR